jgi:hypothetical protein
MFQVLIYKADTSNLNDVYLLNPFRTRQPYLAQKKILEGQKIKGKHFIGVRVKFFKINRNSDKKLFFKK